MSWTNAATQAWRTVSHTPIRFKRSLYFCLELPHSRAVNTDSRWVRQASRSTLDSFMVALLAVLLASCEEEPTQITIELAGRVGDAAFTCGGVYSGVGTTETELTALDFRFYVHDVQLLTERGEVPLELADDGIWQSEGVALIDFENGDGCESGNAPMNTRLVGTVPAGTGAITGLRFRVGVPAERNHLDVSTAPSPLNLSAMFWGWQAGYKYLRIEGRTTGQPGGMRVHVGATGCVGDFRSGMTTCANPNDIFVNLDGFDPESDVLVADLAALLAASDLDRDAGGQPGCMSDLDDPECAAIFEALGITEASTQRFFRFEPQGD